MKQCPCPKFVEARKVLDHLERTHGSITQGKTTDQMVRGGFLTLPKNLEVHTCYYCNLAFAGQPIDRVYKHMQDRCGVRYPKPSDVVFSCRFCGPRRSFETLDQLQNHCHIHLESVREAKANNSTAVKRKDSPPSRNRRDSAIRRSGHRSRSRDRRSSSRSYSRTPERHRRRSSSSERSDVAVVPRFNCFFCSFSSETKANREHHILEQHSNSLFTCKVKAFSNNFSIVEPSLKLITTFFSFRFISFA